MKYLGESFTVASGGTKAYRDGWERTFGKDKSKSNSTEEKTELTVKKIEITKPAEEVQKPTKKSRGRKNEKNKKQKK